MGKTYEITIPIRLHCLNDYIGACRKSKIAGNDMKQYDQAVCVYWIRKCLGTSLKIDKQINIHYKFYELNRKRDKDGILSFAMKVIQDALQQSGVIKNDGWKEIGDFTHEFHVDKDNPRIEITLEEV